MFKASLHITTVFGIPIRLHLSLLLLAFYLGWRMDSLAIGVFVAALLMFSVVLHELGHSLVAQRLGIRVREINLLFFGGMAVMERMPARARSELWLAAAGPAVSLSLSLLAGLLWWGLAATTGFSVIPLLLLSAINLGLGLFNLVPAFPMDGGRILRALLAKRMGRLRATFIAARIGKLLAFVLGLLALMHGNFLLLAVAAFVFFAGAREYHMARIQHVMGLDGGFGDDPAQAPFDDGTTVIVSPPPYEQSRDQRRPLEFDA